MGKNSNLNKEYYGWIEYRYKNAKDKKSFKNELGSLELSASLASWIFAVSPKIDSAERAFFELACAKSIALFPWLWHYDQTEELTKKLINIFIHTEVKFDHEKDWSQIQSRWKQLIQQGIMLRKFEEILSKYKLGDIVNQIDEKKVTKGELLWQGPYGLCVASENCDRTILERKIPVYCLQHESSSQFSAKFLAPVSGIVKSNAITFTKNMSEQEKEILEHFVYQLKNGLKKIK